MKTIYPKESDPHYFHQILQGAITPRPVAFVSTVDRGGHVNLSPFSYFNMFGSNPPILIFSPTNRTYDGSFKDTLVNVLEVPEAVIHIVPFGMVEQMSLASAAYDKGVNEFDKSGLTAVKSQQVQPPRIMESPVAFECKVIEVKPLGTVGGSGNLVIAEVLLVHISELILDDFGFIDPWRLDAIARLGGDWYCRASGNSLFKVPRPSQSKGIGIDLIPEEIRSSPVLTGNNLGRLGGIAKLPDEEEILAYSQREEIQEMRIRYKNDLDSWLDRLHRAAKHALEAGELTKAWLILLQKR